MTLDKDLYTIPQASKYCSISRGALWRWVKSGHLKASLTPGRHYRILKKDLESFMLEKGMYPLANPHSPRKKILILDDDFKIQELLANMLSAHKYETEVASDGCEAGVKTTEFRPGLIILDLFMPGMDGFELCKRLKETLTPHP
jgi:excisionase family DNA binding protein